MNDPRGDFVPEPPVDGDQYTAQVPAHKLLVSGVIRLAHTDTPILVERGMPISSADGQPVGVVAAVLMLCASRQITDVLLSRVPPSAEYRLIPVDLIAQVSHGIVRLRLTAHDVSQLTIHTPDE
jgi:hypothetical protein